jgi:hypothetical protein
MSLENFYCQGAGYYLEGWDKGTGWLDQAERFDIWGRRFDHDPLHLLPDEHRFAR